MKIMTLPVQLLHKQYGAQCMLCMASMHSMHG